MVYMAGYISRLGAAAVLAFWIVLTASAADQSWTYSVTADPIRGGSLGLAQIETSAATLAVRCNGATSLTEVRLFFDDAGDVESVTWWFDNGRRRTERWLRSPNGRSLVVPPALQDRFVRRLRQQRQLGLELLLADGGTQSLALPLNESAVSLYHALQPCER